MGLIASIVIAMVAALHIYFLVLEMFLWDKPAGLKAFGQKLEQAKATKVLAANQGLYNGFLAAGLLWGLWLGQEGVPVQVFLSKFFPDAHSQDPRTAFDRAVAPLSRGDCGVWFRFGRRELLSGRAP